MHRLRSKVAIGQVMSKGYREEVGLNELLDFYEKPERDMIIVILIINFNKVRALSS